MSILSRDFTKKEKILLIVFGIIILGAVYYLLVYRPVEEGIAASRAACHELENQLIVTDAKVKSIKAMGDSMDHDSIKSYMPSYNSSKKELDFLHDTLKATKDYSVNFTDLTREGDQIKREFGLQFVADSYAQAEDIIAELEGCEIRCLVRDFVASPADPKNNLFGGNVVVNLTGTFYETMYDGKADKKLPPDSTAQQTAESALGGN